MDIDLKQVSPFQLKSFNKSDTSTQKDFSHYTLRDREMDFFDGPRFGILGINTHTSINASES